MKWFCKKQEVAQAMRPIDKSFAGEAMTAIVRDYLSEIAKYPQPTEECSANIMLRLEGKGGEVLLVVMPSWAATCNDEQMREEGVSLYLSESIVGTEAFARFCASPVVQVFEKCVKKHPPLDVLPKETYYIIHFGIDAEAISAVLCRLLSDVYSIRTEDTMAVVTSVITRDGDDVEGAPILYDTFTGRRRE